MQFFDVLWHAERREPAVHVELGVLRQDVVVGQDGREVERDVGGYPRLLAARLGQLLDGLLKQAEIEVEADGVHKTRLLRSQQVAGPAHFQVLERHPVPGSQFGMVLQHRQPPLGVVVDAIGYQ